MKLIRRQIDGAKESDGRQFILITPQVSLIGVTHSGGGAHTPSDPGTQSQLLIRRRICRVCQRAGRATR